MDIVDTFNHLIPSDQLDDSLLIGQNLECEASNEFGAGLDQLEDSLKNMLSDKDPMFGSASSQFNLLDNEEAGFQIAGPGLDVVASEAGLRGPGGDLTCADGSKVKRAVGRPRKYVRGGGPTRGRGRGIGRGPFKGLVNTKGPGRPGRKPADKHQISFLIEKVSGVSQLKTELARGGRINLSDLEVGLWLNPVVVLRRLTVTVGGFRIELLPGPSHMSCVENAGVDQTVCYEDCISYGGDVGYAVLQGAVVGAQTSTGETLKGQASPPASKKPCVEDLPLGLGPYVNPNDVQAANGAVLGSTHLAETKLNDQSDSRQHVPVNVGKDAIKAPQHVPNNKVKTSIRTKEQLMLARKQLKSNQGLSFIRNKKNLVSGRPSNMIKGSKLPQHGPSRNIHSGDVNRVQSMKDKQGLAFLKRRGENIQSHSAPKRPLMQDGRPVKLKSKLQGRPSPLVKKTSSSSSSSSSDHHHAGQAGGGKSPHPTADPKPTSTHQALGKTAHPPKRTAEEEDEAQLKLKAKKPEKPVPKQKFKQVRTISVDEPQLFIPDNAPPTVRKESTEENPEKADEAVWDGSKSCGLCQKHHNNMSMVGCGRCDDWFHGDCVGLDLLKVQEMEREDQMYVCLKCCNEETVEEPDPPEEVKPEVQTNTGSQDNKPDPKVKKGPPQPLTPGGVKPCRKDSVERRFSNEAKDSAHKTVKQDTKSKVSSTPSKKPSVDEIRRSVRDSLKEILQKRLKESDLKIPLEKTNEVAKKTERELFHLYKDTDSKYKSKYRSLMFNLKDTKNNVLFRRVLKGEISPNHLIRMSPEELASKELAAWRQRENRHTIEMIEKDQREVERRPITKLTHKGEIEIESQEPAKAPETTDEEPEPAPKVQEELLELPLDTIAPESSKAVKDTTSLHKTHLFDLHCKICTGRMAPPVEESPTKVVKVATTVVRRQSTTEGETKTISPSVKEEDLHVRVLEDSLANSKASEGRLDYTSGRDEENAFLANLKCLWRGFVNMAAVAKLVTRAFPVSGVLDSLTEDLPDSIQVGGRISPQIVWDYLEKIRATGTKEVCLIRFAPETEEDEISYTLLYAYFSSRKRFGVVANNLKQVKDMYIIPLGAIEKVPHQLVPFDGPGLENNRPNLLLGLIIRQRPKRDFLPVDMNETARFIPESKPVTVSPSVAKMAKVEENLFISSLNVIPKKEPEKLLSFVEEVAETPIDSPEKSSVSDEGNSQDSNKPLRFLPGVLLGLGGELPPLPDFGCKGAPTDPPKDQLASKTEGTTPQTSTKSLPTAPRMDRFVIRKREQKPQPHVKSEPVLSSPIKTSTANNFVVSKETGATKPATSVSLTDKYPTPVSLTDEPATSVSLTDKYPTPVSLTDKPATSVSLTDQPATSDSLTEKPPTTVSLNDKPATLVSLTDKPATPVSLTDKPAIPVSLIDTHPAPVSLTGKPVTPVSLTNKLPAPVSLIDTHPAPVSLTDKPATPVSLTDNPATLVSLTDKPASPVSLTDKPASPVSLTDRPAIPVSLTDRPATLVSLTDKLPAPVSLIDTHPAHVSLTDKPATSVSLTDSLPTYMSLTDKPAASVSLTNIPATSVSLNDKPPTSLFLNDRHPTSVSLTDKPLVSVSMRDKPPDMSTETFLASLSPGNEKKSSVSLNKENADPTPDEEKGEATSSANVLAEGNASILSQSQATSEVSKNLRPPSSGILKKSPAYSNLTEEKKADDIIGSASLPALESPQPVPVLSGTRNDPPSVSKHGYSHPSQADYQPRDDLQGNITNSSYGENPSLSQRAPLAPPGVGPYPPAAPGPQAVSYVLTRPEAPEFQYQQVLAAAVPTYGNAAPFHPPPQHPPAPGNYGYPCGPPPNMFPPPALPGQNHGTLWAQGGPLSANAPPGLPGIYDAQVFSKSSNPLPPSAKDYKGPEELYSDPWERPRRSSEDRDSYGSHRPHGESRNSKKSRHDGERGRKHSHEDKYRDRNRDRSRERSRHHGHYKEDRHGDRRGERRHSDEHGSSRHRHRHRRDSDHEKGRRSSKDSYS